MREKRKRPSVFRFSIRTMLVLITLIAVFFGTAFNRANRQKLAVKRLRVANADVQYDVATVGTVSLWRGNTTTFTRNGGLVTTPALRPLPSPKSFLQRILGIDYFHSVTVVNLDAQTVPNFAEIIGAIGALSDVEWVRLNVGGIEPAELAKLKSCPRLKSLSLPNTTIFDRHARWLRGMTQLEHLRAVNEFTDEGLAELEGHPNLSEIYLSYQESITDKGAVSLATLSKLQTLDVSSTSITDVGVQEFRKLKSLDWLDLSFTKTTDASIDTLVEIAPSDLRLLDTCISNEGADRLRKLLPGTEVKHSDARLKHVLDAG